jgi:opacity protein-like surface antigen
MRKLITLLFTVIIAFTMYSNSHAQINVGGGLVYGGGVFDGAGADDINNHLGLTVDGYYTVTPEIRAGAGFTFYFPQKYEENFNGGSGEVKATVWEFNINGNYIFLQNEGLDLYGIAGINITGVSQESSSSGGGMTFNQSSSDSELGLNIGAGAEYDMDFGDLFGELKFGGIGGDADQVVLSAGVRIPIDLN